MYIKIRSCILPLSGKQEISGSKELSFPTEETLDDTMEQMQRDIVDIKNCIVYLKILMQCMYKVFLAVLAENRNIFLEVSRMDSKLEDVETDNWIHIGEKEEIRWKVEEMKRF